ncbi:flagellar motor protein MotB [Robertmurraya sp. GLU-23]
MSKKRKKGKYEDHVDESWLIPYADLLTLLLALFIVLFSMSSIDAKKFNAMSQAFNEVLTGGTGVMEYPEPDNNNSVSKDTTQEQQKQKNENNNLSTDVEQNELEKIQNKVTTYINERNLQKSLETQITDEGLLITINNNMLFDSGAAEIRLENIEIAKDISELLIMDTPREIVISGHTDNVPIQYADFDSNWELSVKRAVNFMKILLNNKGLDPRLFSVKGFGEFKPIATNDTEEGKARNRRVEILVLHRE